MSRGPLFNSPLLLGFDHLEQTLDRLQRSAGDGYPPHNVESLDGGRLRITLAVAGFGEDDLSIRVENNQLVIRGKQQDDQDRIYLHRGIAARQFQRSFMLAEGIEIAGARLDNGLLHIDLLRPLEETRVRSIPIQSAKGRGGKIATQRTAHDMDQRALRDTDTEVEAYPESAAPESAKPVGRNRKEEVER